MAVAVKPSKSLINIRSGIKSIKDSFSGLRKNSENLNEVMLKKTKIKRESIARNYILSQRRQEEERRKNKEDLLEASSIGGAIKRQGRVIASSTKGFLGRIMDFLGTLLVGWLLTNLPSIITMAQELIARIQRLYTIVTGFFDNTVNLFRGFGNLLGAVGKNILTFDFTDSKGRVESALKDLGGTFDDMQSQFDEGFKLLTTSLGEGVVSGENAKPFGTQYENESMQEQPSGGGFSGTGVVKGTQIAKRLQKDLGLKDYQAAAVVGNLLQENTNLVPDLLEGSKKGLLPEAMRKGIGYGWAQWTYPSRQQELFNLAKSMGVDPTKQPLTDEINYAMLVRELIKYDSGGRFRNSKNIEEASNWILFQYENPADKGKREQGERIEDSRRVLKGMGVETSLRTPIAKPRPAQTAPAVSTSVIDQFKGKPGGAAGIITSERGMRLSPTTGKYRMHHGIDIAPAGPGYYVALKLSGTISDVSLGYSGGYGNYVDVKSGNTIYRFAHLAKVLVKKGQSYNGQTIGEIGNTGSGTGIHLHFEVRPGGGDSINPRPYLGLLSIGKQLTGAPGQPAQIAAPTPAQITPSGTQQRRQASQQLAQQPAGPSIIIIEEEPPAPQPQVSVGGGGSMMIPIVINPLNSFITKKLLLDLAYT
jgi:murein DD-endopeptidase MepM/ murein hydrolase activator NlpD